MTLTLPARLAHTAAAYPGTPALILGEEETTYAEFHRQVRHLAGLLRAEGVSPGDRVALMLPNIPAFPMLLFAVLEAGGVVVPMNPLFKEREITHVLADSGATMLWAGPSPEAAASAQACGVQLRVVGPDGLAPHIAPHLTASPGPADTPAPRTLEDDAVLLYTSGTTGRPKGARLTHRNLGTNTDAVAETLLRLTAEDTVLGCLPLFHVFGMTCALLTSVTVGASLVLIPRFDAAGTLAAIRERRATIMLGVPTMLGAMLAAGGDRPEDLATLRIVVSGGSSLPVEILHRFEATFGCEILEGYGLSETSPVACINRPGEEHRAGSIGRPLRGCRMQLVARSGEVIPEGDDGGRLGEIWIRGENVMAGYWGDPEATAQAITSEGWFRSGDIGRRDAEGNYYIVDRLKDVILRGGMNVYPREVEEVLYEHPAVAEAAVVGVPHPLLGQEVAAFVVLAPGARSGGETTRGQGTIEQELIAFVRDRVAPYKYPRTVTVRDGLPKVAAGKILKRELAAEAAAGPGGH
ncbi:long-chain fatty acid--CoA ligase [Micrococcus sp.]|uniref:long-chain-fatty-acid--CoA ligase n=1 Tax=Micrococcus sp. TaxID=1271 RepID=UPI002A91E164|nr:long-chain fatty acid--CoA ligase [Micrococcus sp.]MDY6054514.1 long-chain fatty acid--CoA ligase [Micrococcus sp.]